MEGSSHGTGKRARRSGEAARDRPRARNTAAAIAEIGSGVVLRGFLPDTNGQDGTFALNVRVRAASVVNRFLISRLAPVRKRSIHAVGRTEKYRTLPVTVVQTDCMSVDPDRIVACDEAVTRSVVTTFDIEAVVP